MLEVRNLSKRYRGIPALEGVSFEIHPGEILGYLGPNGSGKSTTVKILTGLLDASEGSVYLDGRSMTDDIDAYRARLGYVPEEPHLYTHLTGREYLELCARLRGFEEKLLGEKIDRFLRLFHLWEARHGFLHSYSKGMRQRILILAALLHNPQLIVLDEPFSGLDVNTALLFRHLLTSLAARGKIIFFSTHVFEVVEKLCNRVIILHKGQLVAQGTVEDLRRAAETPSLEEVFRQLTQQPDLAAVAQETVATMELA